MMNRCAYSDYIEDRLNTLATSINSRGRLNILNLNIHAENFYLHFLNLLFGWRLENLNSLLQNVEAIDLVDNTNKLIIQVSATNTKQKIDTALSKDILMKYIGYTFKFICISKDGSELRSKSYDNPHGMIFIPSIDILDKEMILNKILTLDIAKQKEIHSFIIQELGNQIDFVKLDSNLATIINILSKEDLTEIDGNTKMNTFQIDKKIEYNQLDVSRMFIDDYKVQHTRIEKNIMN